MLVFVASGSRGETDKQNTCSGSGDNTCHHEKYSREENAGEYLEKSITNRGKGWCQSPRGRKMSACKEVNVIRRLPRRAKRDQRNDCGIRPWEPYRPLEESQRLHWGPGWPEAKTEVGNQLGDTARNRWEIIRLGPRARDRGGETWEGNLNTLKSERAEFADKIAHGMERERKKVFLNSKVLSGIFTWMEHKYL